MALVSVVTPFYNTALYLEECIESVLGQTFGDFEYVLVDNHSTDESYAIAERYAARDARIRLFKNEKFVGQVENYNGALARIANDTRFVKIVQADDAILPDCLRAMSEVGQRDERIGIVSSYYLKGDVPTGSGVPRSVWRVPGRDVLRTIMIGNAFPLGSPTTVLYRADIVRSRTPFYELGRYHEDTEKACQILLEHDLGYVPQILSFLRTDNESIMSAARRFNPVPLDHLILLERFGRQVLSAEEFERQSSAEWRAYWGFLGASLLAGRGPEFWNYHRRGLNTIGRSLSKRDLLVPTLKQFSRMALNPLQTAEGGFRVLRANRGK
ncbi:MAG TPA: glycosyltransferase family 2 protein [Polyangiaceae bacterium]|nr:glycosyltransferase family 2 protein [Polyangiaceae bacterium]